MDYKRSYTRGDLTHETEGTRTYGGVQQVCSLCGNESLPGLDLILHDADCPLLDPDVMGVMMTALSKPKSVICEACPEDDCMAGDWHVCVHETLLKCCHRYAKEVGGL